MGKSEWSASARNGKATGVKTKKFKAAKISLVGADGSLKFRVHGVGGTWSNWAESGKVAAVDKGTLNSVRIKLTGKVAKTYNIAYRVHALGGSWGAWKLNGKVAGKASDSTRVDLLQVKLVKKGAKVVKNTRKIVRVGVASMSSGGETPTCNYVRKCGMVPVRITSVKTDISKFDGLVLPGSINDVSPSLYGEKQSPMTYKPRIARDLLFIGSVKKFAKAEKPVLGICGGAQHMNVAMGGTLTQHIPGRHGGMRSVRITKNSFFYQIFGASEPTYHAHHQCAKKLGPNMVATEFDARDGRIEAIEHETLPLFGVQWHPEAMGARGVEAGRLFRSECLAYRV